MNMNKNNNKPVSILIIKTSSMGDVIHTLPAIEDLYRNLHNIKVDWIVEPGFSEIPAWHLAVNKIIKLPLRKWRKNPLKYIFNGEIISVIKNIRAKKYDYIIDLQGLVKSAIFAKFAKGIKYGLCINSIREKLAAIFYNKKITVLKNQHAITRNRQLLAKIFQYNIDQNDVSYGLNKSIIKNIDETLLSKINFPYLVFLHGTTWASKHWPESYWFELAKITTDSGLNICVTYANDKQYQFVQKIAKISNKIHIIPTMSISQAAKLIANSSCVVGVDTGFCHLSAALDQNTISIFGSTDINKSKPLGKNQAYFSSKFSCSPCMSKDCRFSNSSVYLKDKIFPPCYKEISPQLIFDEIHKRINL